MKTHSRFLLVLFLGVPAAFGLIFGYYAEYTVAQSIALASGLFLLATWLLSRAGTELGAITRSPMVAITVSILFLVLLVFSFVDVRAGDVIPERPVSFFICLMAFLPYGISACLDIVIR